MVGICWLFSIPLFFDDMECLRKWSHSMERILILGCGLYELFIMGRSDGCEGHWISAHGSAHPCVQNRKWFFIFLSRHAARSWNYWCISIPYFAFLGVINSFFIISVLKPIIIVDLIYFSALGYNLSAQRADFESPLRRVKVLKVKAHKPAKF